MTNAKGILSWLPQNVGLVRNNFTRSNWFTYILFESYLLDGIFLINKLLYEVQ